MSRFMLPIVASLFAVAGCAGEVEVQELSLARGAACGDLTVVIANEAGTTALVIEAEGLVAQALRLEDVVMSSWTLPRADVSVEVVTGEGLAEGLCDGTAIIDSATPAVEGFVALNVTPQDEQGDGAHVDVQVADLLAADAEGPAMSVSALDADVLVRPQR